AHRSTLDNRQAEKRYNLWSLDDFAAKAPGLDWGAFLKAAGFEGQATFLISQPEAITGVAAAARDVPLADWRDYLVSRVLRAYARSGPQPLVEADFAFFGKTLAGTQELAQPWKRASEATDAALGAAVGHMYM